MRGYSHFLIALSVLLGAAVIAAWRRVLVLDGRRVRGLYRVFLLHLSLPSLLFLLALPLPAILRLVMSLILIGFLHLAMEECRRWGRVGMQSKTAIRLDALVLFLGLLAISYADLIWGQGFVADWKKHRSVLISLYLNPTHPGLDGFIFEKNPWLQGMRLVYYYGQYLPAAYLGRVVLAFFPAADVPLICWVLVFLFSLWLFIGMTLVSLLLPTAMEGLLGKRKTGQAWGIAYLGIMAFSGLNIWCKYAGWFFGIFGYATTLPVLRPLGFFLAEAWERLFRGLPTWYTADRHAEWWTPFFAQIASFISDWQWTPQHLLAGLSGLVLLGLFRDRMDRLPFCVGSTSLLSTSVFCWIGILPLTGWVMALWFFGGGKDPFLLRMGRLLNRLKWQIVGTAVFAGVFLLFYSSVSPPPGMVFAERAKKLGFNEWLDLKDGTLRIGLFYLIEFTPSLIVLIASRRWTMRNPSLPWLSLLFSSILSLFWLGGNNDLVLRGTIPAMLVLMVFCGYMIQEGWGDRKFCGRWAIALFLLLVVPHCLNELVMGLTARSPLLEDSPFVVAQYVSRTQSLFQMWHR